MSKILRRDYESGFGVAELLVSTVIFSIILLGMVSYSNLTFSNLGLENRASSSARELRNAISLLSSELRMSSSVSPYLPGDNPDDVTCSSQITATSNSIRFLVVHDDSSAPSGIQPYYVGYIYDVNSKQLLRGEIPGTTTTNCSLPVENPLSPDYARVVADRVSPFDQNGDGITEPPFYFANGTLTINLSIEVDGQNGAKRSQGISTRIYARNSL